MANDTNLKKATKAQDENRRKQSKKFNSNKFNEIEKYKLKSKKVNHSNQRNKRLANKLNLDESSYTSLGNELKGTKYTVNNKSMSPKEFNYKIYDFSDDEFSTRVTKKKAKKSKKPMNFESSNLDNEQGKRPQRTTLSEDLNLKVDELSTRVKKKKVKKSKKQINFESSNLDNEEENGPQKSTLSEDLNFKVDDGYKPGMITELLQIRKFGKVILPWDPSFGLDPTYKPPPWEGKGPKPIVDPLFDLSKRKNVGTVGSVDASVCSVFVGNLNFECRVGDIKKLFRKCGKILKAKLVKSGSDKVRKQINAIIRFETVEGCTAALKMNGKLYKGHHLRVTLQACAKADPRRSIFVGNIAFGAGDDDLWNVFENCGAIESIRIVRDTQTGKSRGFGYVNFKSSDSVDMALALDKVTVLGHELRVMKNEGNVRSLSNTIKVKRKNKKRKKLIANSQQETEGRKKLVQNTNNTEVTNEVISHSTKKGKNKIKKCKSKSGEEEGSVR